MGFRRSQVVVLLLGIGVSLGETVLAWNRAAPAAEVFAAFLSIFVFIGAVYGYVIGGIAGAIAASVLYGAVLSAQTNLLGYGLVVGLIAGRVWTYTFFGVAVGFGMTFIRRRLQRLALHDQFDDMTDLYNAAYFLQLTDQELERSRQYRTIFSVSQIDIDREALNASARKYKRVLVELARAIRSEVRPNERACRVDDERRDRIFVVHPEMGREAVEAFVAKLVQLAGTVMASQHVEASGHLTSSSFTCPADIDPFSAARAEVAFAEETKRMRKSIEKERGT